MTNHQKEIERLLARRIGLDPVAVGPHLSCARRGGGWRSWAWTTSVFMRRGWSRSEAELQALIEEVVVPESWFFRDERPFRWLADYVRERWVGNPARPPLRRPEPGLCRG